MTTNEKTGGEMPGRGGDAERALPDGDGLFRTLFENAGDAILLIRDSLFVDGNVRAVQMFGGRERGQIVGHSPAEFSPVVQPNGRDSRQLADEKIAAAVAGEPQLFEWTHMRLDGTVFSAEINLASVKLGDGRLLQAIVRDVTENKQNKEVQVFLAQASGGAEGEPFFNALARYLAQSLKMEFVCIDRLEGDGLTARTLAVWCDGRFEDNVTYALKDTPCGDVVGKTVCCFPASVCQFFPRDQVLKDLQAESYAGVTLWGHTGQPIGLIAVIGRGPLINRPQVEATLKLVAGRAAGELERLSAEEALRESERLLKESQAIASLGSYVLDIATGVWQSSDELDRLFGINKSYERSVEGWASLIHPADRDMMVDYLTTEVYGQRRVFDKEYRIVRHADHAERWVHGLGKLELDARGSPLRMHGTVQDITERKLTETALRESEEEFHLLAEAMPQIVWKIGRAHV